MIAVTPAVSGGDPVTRRCMSRAPCPVPRAPCSVPRAPCPVPGYCREVWAGRFSGVWVCAVVRTRPKRSGTSIVECTVRSRGCVSVDGDRHNE